MTETEVSKSKAMSIQLFKSMLKYDSGSCFYRETLLLIIIFFLIDQLMISKQSIFYLFSLNVLFT